MMKVCYSELDGPEGLSCRLEAAGHAGFAPAGQDIVCAGASTLMQALVYLLAGEENAHADAWEEPDGPRLAVQADAPCAAWVQGAFELAKAGFTLLAERYPDNIRFADVSRRGEQSMMDLQMFAEEAAPAAPALSPAQARQAVLELLEVANLKSGDIFVVGCSSSEMVGQRIGKGSSLEAAQAAFDGIYPVLQERGIYLAAQCCEHLNRSLIVEEAAADKYDLDVVNVQPWEHAGGSFATTAFARFEHPVAVTHVRAKAGIDIGGTLIGMHLKEVAVPVRLSIKQIGEANILCARTRPPYVGGERARYREDMK